jgi:hypothetical protein
MNSMFSNLELPTMSYLLNERISPEQERRQAGYLFDMAYERGLYRKVWTKLTGRKHELRSLNHYPSRDQTRRLSEVLNVRLDQIVGSEGRSADFDANFNPLKRHIRPRWVGIFIALQSGIPLPPVELIRMGNEYFVRDGHHRISVAKARGQLEIEARIVN